MATVTRVQVAGLRELGLALKGLGNELGGKIARGATAAAARVVKKAAVSNIERSPSVRTGSLRDAVIVKKLPASEANGLTSAHIVTVRGRGKPYNKKGVKIDRAPHGHLVEFGTVNMPAEPYMRPAFDQKKGDALNEMADTLRTGIDRAAKKVGKK